MHVLCAYLYTLYDLQARPLSPPLLLALSWELEFRQNNRSGDTNQFHAVHRFDMIMRTRGSGQGLGPPAAKCRTPDPTLCSCPCCSKGSASGLYWVQSDGAWALSPNMVPEQSIAHEQQQQYYQHPHHYQQAFYQIPAVAAPTAPAPAPVLSAVRPAALSAVLRVAAAAAADGRTQQRYPSVTQGMVPLPPIHDDDAMVLDLCLDDLQELAQAEAVSEATEQRVVASEGARTGEEGARWVHLFAGSQCVGSAVYTSAEFQNASMQQGGVRLSHMSSSEGYPHDEPPPSPCIMQ